MQAQPPPQPKQARHDDMRRAASTPNPIELYEMGNPLPGSFTNAPSLNNPSTAPQKAAVQAMVHVLTPSADQEAAELINNTKFDEINLDNFFCGDMLVPQGSNTETGTPFDNPEDAAAPMMLIPLVFD
jgi:hypothetical protein